jgi:hypothetical protein
MQIQALFQSAAVPEPSTWAMLLTAAGAVLLGCVKPKAACANCQAASLLAVAVALLPVAAALPAGDMAA